MDERKRPSTSVISLRVTWEERACLEKEAQGESLGIHIRSIIFGDKKVVRHKRGKMPVKDYTALGQVLGLLGRTQVYTSLEALTKASDEGLLTLSEEQNTALLEACADIRAIREYLMRALGKGAS